MKEIELILKAFKVYTSMSEFIKTLETKNQTN